MSSWLLLLFLTQAGLTDADVVTNVERSLFLMGTELELSVEARDREAALLASESAVRVLEATEDRLTTWRPHSELALLNQAPLDTEVALSAALERDLRDARWCWEATSGAFDPTVGALVEVWGLRHGGRLPSAGELRRARAATGMDGLDLKAGFAFRRRPGLKIDEGGFGKGIGLAAAADTLAADTSVLRASLDLGGQLILLGRETTWTVALADPGDRGRAVVEMTVNRGSISTSGNGERGVELGPFGQTHLLDPRTGLPVPNFGSLTVWTDDPVRADCLSSGLYVLGPDRALSWAAEHPGFEVLVLEPGKDGLRARATPGLAGRLRPLVPDLVLHIVSNDGTQPAAVPGRWGHQRTEGKES